MDIMFHQIGDIYAIEEKGMMTFKDSSGTGMHLSFERFFNLPKIVDYLKEKILALGVDPLNFHYDSYRLIEVEKILNANKPAIILQPYVIFVDTPFKVFVTSEAGKKSDRLWCVSWEGFFAHVPDISQALKQRVDNKQPISREQKKLYYEVTNKKLVKYV